MESSALTTILQQQSQATSRYRARRPVPCNHSRATRPAPQQSATEPRDQHNISQWVTEPENQHSIEWQSHATSTTAMSDSARQPAQSESPSQSTSTDRAKQQHQQWVRQPETAPSHSDRQPQHSGESQNQRPAQTGPSTNTSDQHKNG